MVTFVFSNPKHHLEMMVPIARELSRRGMRTRFVSLADLRGFVTPDIRASVADTEVRRVIPRRIRTDPSTGTGVGISGGTGAFIRGTAQRLLWRAALRPRLRWLLRGSHVVVVPNDNAFPYAPLAIDLRERNVVFALLQEGIRFPLPAEKTVCEPYGSSGAPLVCVWGEGSAEYFRSVSDGSSVVVTGNPRFDTLDPTAWHERGVELLARLGLARAPMLYLSNTIDDQGFCTTAAKMQLFGDFVRTASPALSRENRGIIVKLHPREDIEMYREVARANATVPVHVLRDEPLFSVLAAGHVAVVLASTVGLEALAFGIPLGVLEIPGHGHAFEYVARKAAIPLSASTLGDDVARLLDIDRHDRPLADAFVERHMAHRGDAAVRIADNIVELGRRSV